jgi:hypothetical protein
MGLNSNLTTLAVAGSGSVEWNYYPVTECVVVGPELGVGFPCLFETCGAWLYRNVASKQSREPPNVFLGGVPKKAGISPPTTVLGNPGELPCHSHDL